LGKDHSDVVEWLPGGGKAFKIHKKEDFCEDLLPAFLNISSHNTFQCNMRQWGFKRIPRGPGKRALLCPLLFQANADLCKNTIHNKRKTLSSVGKRQEAKSGRYTEGKGRKGQEKEAKARQGSMDCPDYCGTNLRTTNKWPY
jgi:hypothetical protein